MQSESVTKHEQDHTKDTNKLEDGFTAAADRQPETLSQPGTAAAESGDAFIATEAPRTVQTTTQASAGEDTDCGGKVVQAQARDVVLTESVAHVAEVRFNFSLQLYSTLPGELVVGLTLFWHVCDSVFNNLAWCTQVDKEVQSNSVTNHAQDRSNDTI